MFSLMSIDNTISLTEYTFNLKFDKSIELSDFNGSAWRGLLGHSLKKTACVTGHKICQDCLLKSNCAYHYIFETEPDQASDRMRKYNAVPHPFVIKNQAKKIINTDKNLELNILLIGKANTYMPYLVQSMIKAGAIGVTKGRNQFSVETVTLKNNQQVIWSKGSSRVQSHETVKLIIPELPVSKPYIQLKLVTPLKITSEGRLLRAKAYKFSHLIRSLTRRISMLSYFHCNDEISIDFKAIHELSESVEMLSSDLKDIRWKRFSSRQKKLMFVEGITGEFVVNLSDYKALWPLLYIGSKLHAGKLTSMGLGEYKITTLASLPNE